MNMPNETINIPLDKLGELPVAAGKWTNQHYTAQHGDGSDAQNLIIDLERGFNLAPSITDEDLPLIAAHFSQRPLYPIKNLLIAQLCAYFGIENTPQMNVTVKPTSIYYKKDDKIYLRCVMSDITLNVPKDLKPNTGFYDGTHPEYKLSGIDVALNFVLDTRAGYVEGEAALITQEALHLDAADVSSNGSVQADFIVDLLTYKSETEQDSLKSQRRAIQNSQGFSAVLSAHQQAKIACQMDAEIETLIRDNAQQDPQQIAIDYLTERMLPRDAWSHLRRIYHNHNKTELAVLQEKFDKYVMSETYVTQRNQFDAAVDDALVNKWQHSQHDKDAQSTKTASASSAVTSSEAQPQLNTKDFFINARVDILYPKLVAAKQDDKDNKTIESLASQVRKDDKAKACAEHIYNRIIAGNCKVGWFGGRVGGVNITITHANETKTVTVSHSQQAIFNLIQTQLQLRATYKAQKKHSAHLEKPKSWQSWSDVLQDVLKELDKAEKKAGFGRSKQLAQSYKAMRADIENAIPNSNLTQTAHVETTKSMLSAITSLFFHNPKSAVSKAAEVQAFSALVS